MKCIMGLLLLPLLLQAYSAVGNTMEEALNSKLLETLISPQSSVEATATMAHTSPLGSVGSMGPMVMDYGMSYMSPYSYDFSMPYAHPVMPYMGAGVPFSPPSPYTSSYPYSGMGFPAMSSLMAFPAYTSGNPLMLRIPGNQMAIPVVSASSYGYF